MDIFNHNYFIADIYLWKLAFKIGKLSWIIIIVDKIWLEGNISA
jgi:hypothetical protein